MKRKWILPVVLIAAVGVLVAANLWKAGGSSRSTAAGGPKDAPQVKVVKLAPRSLTQKVMAPGTLEASEPMELRAPFTTMSVKLLVGPGDVVKAGQVVAELESDELKLQAVAQEAAVARAEASLAGYRQQQQTAPTALAVKVESARAQLLAAEAGLTSALEQGSLAQQKLAQAQSALLAAQNRAGAGSAEVAAARQKLQQAEADYRANPLGAQERSALDAAQAAYNDALRRSAESAKQTAADLAQAYDNLTLAQKDVAKAGEDSSAVRQARAQLEGARLSLEAARADAEAGGVSAETIRSAEADLAAQRANLANLRQKLEQASLKAPVGGTVLSVALKNGQPAQQGQELLELGGLQVLTLKARVDEVDVGKVKVGQSLAVKNNAYPTDKFDGKVTRVAAQAGQTAGAGGAAAGSFYEVEGTVTNRESMLRAGMSAEAHVVTDSRSGVIVVGLESVREEGDQASVLVVRDFKVHVTPVKLGLRTQTEVEVLEGLKEGDEVIVSPFTLIKSLKDGDPVRTEVVEAQERGDDE